MINEENKAEWIRAYTYNELEGEDLRVFKEKMQNDAAFKEDVDLFLVLRAAHNVEQKEHFKTLLAEDDLKLVEPTNTTEETPKKEEKTAKVVTMEPQKTGTRTWLLRAASLLLIGLVGAVLYFNLPTQQNALALSQEYLQTQYDSPVITRSETAVQQDWETAVQAYENQNFEKALVSLDRIIETGKAKDQHYFYAGLSALYQKKKDPQKAIDAFNQVKGGLYGEALNWYKALAYIQLEQYDKAKQLLTPIATSGSPQRQPKAAKLLEGI